MIHILKQGKPAAPEVFHCYYCGCDFEADRRDYTKIWDQSELSIKLVASCPCCPNVVTKLYTKVRTE